MQNPILACVPARAGTANGSPCRACAASPGLAASRKAAAPPCPLPDWRGPDLGELGRADPTKDERRLLRALVAAQAGDWPVLDNYLCKFALDRRQRAGLADAVCALAAALAASGFVLPASPPASVPAPALRVAFMHGLTLDEIDVAWPVFLEG